MNEIEKSILKCLLIASIILIISIFISIIVLLKSNLKEYEITFISCEFNEEKQRPKLRVSYLDEENNEHYVEKTKLTELEKYIISLGIDESFNCNSYRVFIVVEENKHSRLFNNSAGIQNWYLAID